MGVTFDGPVAQISLSDVAASSTFRLDPRYHAKAYVETEAKVRSADFFQLGSFLPTPFVKGVQPQYLDAPTDDSVPVINTLSIQNLTINQDACRHITQDDFDELDNGRKLKTDDVLLTMDGGVSIGKPVLFDLEGDYTVDSHVCILRPDGMKPRSLVYLLASPLGQDQFKRAESGASGQTAVTEEDIRRFIFPSRLLKDLDNVVAHIEAERALVLSERRKLFDRERAAWAKLEALAS